ncbi:C40 family peptidase [Fuscovulum blasticum]|uniref:C40 family peptidase n=1 Tax=Fuscovulum blasticum TaxID=1075 RepID=UPI0013DE886D|nr:NlpC/P60 family protein [Fuscovulum blasticum]
MTAARSIMPAPTARPWWEAYVGLPFVDGGRGPDAYDCWGLVRQVYADLLGIDLPSYGEISAMDLIRIARTMRAGADDGWRVPAIPDELDVVLMRGTGGRSSVVHVGVMVSQTRLLHIEAGSGAVVVPVSHWSVAGRIIGWRRRA